mgnify:CR=1 FL=1
MKISIVIPVYEAHGEGVRLLQNCLDSICAQNFDNFEIVIPDHSVNDDIKQFITKYNNLDILHFYNERGRGNSSINMNEGIKRASGDIIKIMHFDDLFYIKNALQFIHNEFNSSDLKWGGVGFNHLQGHSFQGPAGSAPINGHTLIRRPMIPIKTGPVAGKLTGWGCPSMSFFINDKSDPMYFDENLIWINDHEMHISLLKKYGAPIVVKDICVTIRIHENQVSKTVSSTEEQEWEYFYKKHPELFYQTKIQIWS